MPRKSGDRFDDLDIEHRGSHPEYTKTVNEAMDAASGRLKRKYKTDNLDAVPPGEIKKEMNRIENEFRGKIETNDKSIPIKDGRLSMLPLQTRRSGNYEIRV